MMRSLYLMLFIFQMIYLCLVITVKLRGCKENKPIQKLHTQKKNNISLIWNSIFTRFFCVERYFLRRWGKGRELSVTITRLFWEFTTLLLFYSKISENQLHFPRNRWPISIVYRAKAALEIRDTFSSPESAILLVSTKEITDSGGDRNNYFFDWLLKQRTVKRQ